MATGMEAAARSERDLIEEIPGEEGLPIVGNTLRLLKDPSKFGQEMVDKYGLTYRTKSFGFRNVQMLGPDANEFILMDRDQNFSSETGWNKFLERLFPRGLMLLDFDHHRAHRKILQAAFKPAPMKGYTRRLGEVVAPEVDAWAEKGQFLFYPAIKQLTLDTAANVFLGLDSDQQDKKVNKALTDMVLAAVGLFRAPLPFTAMKRGVDGRKYMIKYLTKLIKERRGKDYDDMFTHICNATDDDGNSFTDQEIIDHMNFMWMAAHDTITSSVTTLVYELGRNRDWQQKLREEIEGLELDGGLLPYEKLGDLPLLEMAFKEALRINPPVPGVPRTAVRDITYKNYRIPKGTHVSISPIFTHRMEEIWPEPEKFDPMRFTPEEVRKRHKYAWVPFGGGAHMCLGLHFAYMQAKVIMAHLLPRYDIVLDEGYSTTFQVIPLMKPADGLPITLKKLS